MRLEFRERAFEDLQYWVQMNPKVAKRLLGISFFIPSAPFPPKARGRRGFDLRLELDLPFGVVFIHGQPAPRAFNRRDGFLGISRIYRPGTTVTTGQFIDAYAPDGFYRTSESRTLPRRRLKPCDSSLTPPPRLRESSISLKIPLLASLVEPFLKNAANHLIENLVIVFGTYLLLLLFHEVEQEFAVGQSRHMLN